MVTRNTRRVRWDSERAIWICRVDIAGPDGSARTEVWVDETNVVPWPDVCGKALKRVFAGPLPPLSTDSRAHFAVLDFTLPGDDQLLHGRFLTRLHRGRLPFAVNAMLPVDALGHIADVALPIVRVGEKFAPSEEPEGSLLWPKHPRAVDLTSARDQFVLILDRRLSPRLTESLAAEAQRRAVFIAHTLSIQNHITGARPYDSIILGDLRSTADTSWVDRLRSLGSAVAFVLYECSDAADDKVIKACISHNLLTALLFETEDAAPYWLETYSHNHHVRSFPYSRKQTAANFLSTVLAAVSEWAGEAATSGSGEGPHDSPPGYVELQPLGAEGAWKVVYKARDQWTGAWVAIKRYKDLTREAFDRLRIKEGLGHRDMVAKDLRAAAISHPNIQPCEWKYDRYGRLFIVEPLLDETLEAAIVKTRALAFQAFYRYATDIAAGIRYLHDTVHMVHCDIKMDNIGIKNGIVKICDLGIATLLAPEQRMRSYPGTIRTRAPELFGKGVKPSVASDMWAVGCVFYAMLTGGDYPLLPKAITIPPAADAAGRRKLEKELHKRIRRLTQQELDQQVASAVPVTCSPVVLACLQVDPVRRDTAAKLESRLEQTQAEIGGLCACVRADEVVWRCFERMRREAAFAAQRDEWNAEEDASRCYLYDADGSSWQLVWLYQGSPADEVFGRMFEFEGGWPEPRQRVQARLSRLGMEIVSLVEEKAIEAQQFARLDVRLLCREQ